MTTRDNTSQGEPITTPRATWNEELGNTPGTYRHWTELEPGFTIAQPHVSDQGDDYVTWLWSTLESIGYADNGDFIETFSAGPAYSNHCPAGSGSFELTDSHLFFSRSPEEQEAARLAAEV